MAMARWFHVKRSKRTIVVNGTRMPRGQFLELMAEGHRKRRHLPRFESVVWRTHGEPAGGTLDPDVGTAQMFRDLASQKPATGYRIRGRHSITKIENRPQSMVGKHTWPSIHTSAVRESLSRMLLFVLTLARDESIDLEVSYFQPRRIV